MSKGWRIITGDCLEMDRFRLVFGDFFLQSRARKKPEISAAIRPAGDRKRSLLRLFSMTLNTRFTIGNSKRLISYTLVPSPWTCAVHANGRAPTG